MADALDTALGKPGSDLIVVYIGTLAPAMAGWWADLIAAGTEGSTLRASADRRRREVGSVARDPALQSADGGVCGVACDAPRRTRRGAQGFAAQSAVSVLPDELPDRR